MGSSLGGNGSSTREGQLRDRFRCLVRCSVPVRAPRRGTMSRAFLMAGSADRVLIHDTKFDLVRKPDVSARQSPYYFTGSGPLLIAQCQFYLSSGNLWDHAVRNRVTFRDNFIDMHDGLGCCMSSEKLLFLRNELTFHPAAPWGSRCAWRMRHLGIAGLPITARRSETTPLTGQGALLRASDSREVPQSPRSTTPGTRSPPQTPPIFGTLCEGNTIKNSSVGFDLDGSFSFAIRSTTYANCPKPLNDRGYDTAILADAPTR
jgi:hypothetical protein